MPTHAQSAASSLALVLGPANVTAIQTPRQTNAYDCGVYILAIAQQVCALRNAAVGVGELAVSSAVVLRWPHDSFSILDSG